MEGDGMNKVASGHKGFPADQGCHSFAFFFNFLIKIKTLALRGSCFGAGGYVFEIVFDFALPGTNSLRRRKQCNNTSFLKTWRR